MKPTPAARSKARRFAVQALYQVQLTGDSLPTVERQFLEDHDMKRVDTTYLHEILHGVATRGGDLWAVLTPLLDRQQEELTPVEKAILQLGTYEMLARIDIPYRVVIDESIELAKTFGANESYKYINSVLDAVARAHRQVETGT